MSRADYFVTHPDVVIDPAIPVHQWALSERGRYRMQRLLCQDWIPDLSAIYCSTEQKAIDGAAILSDALGLPAEQVEALGENDRSSTGYLPAPEFKATADAFFASPHQRIRGWERAIDAQARIVDAITDIASTAPGGGAIIVVSHGGVGTLLLCHLKGVPIARVHDQPGSNGGNYTNQVDFCHKFGGPSERESTGVGTRKYGKIEQGWYYFFFRAPGAILVHGWRPIDG